ncbi:hypothetical protein F383_05306 [Gossypium arboreum]|uniref:Uncharacterized protein n=1 Tax=Gossypium arboreum TaxID=29729 RepID=A0A0B0N4W1_GOSAR|nr:hypothetical protein F383_35293 [Gossypium arboreum]KHG23099.1 hypothetical protein F383_05306 [Gossypium arboreum]
MPTFQMWSYMSSHIDATVPDRVSHKSNTTKTHISMPTSQMWFYMKTHILMPTSHT